MADDPSIILKKILDEGEKFNYRNFAAIGRYGYPVSYNSEYLSWRIRAKSLLQDKFGLDSPAYQSFLEGERVPVLENGHAKFDTAHAHYLGAIKSAMGPVPIIQKNTIRNQTKDQETMKNEATQEDGRTTVKKSHANESGYGKNLLQENILAGVISGLIVAFLTWAVGFVIPQVKISLETIVYILIVLNFVVRLSPREDYRIVRATLIKRIFGGLFWIAIGALMIMNQYTGKVDSQLITYGGGSIFLIVGLIQIFDRYDVLKEMPSRLWHAKNYDAKVILDNVISESYDELYAEDDREEKRKLIERVDEKIQAMIDEKKITKENEDNVKKIRKKALDEMDYEDILAKYT